VNPPTVVLVAGSRDPGTIKGDVGEADLDLELSGGVAPDASIIYVNSTDVFESLQYAVDQNLAPVMSISYGGCEQQFDPAGRSDLAATAMQANAQGITITAASGDSGAADCDSGSASSPAKIATQGLAVDVPASLPYVTGVGGTRFEDSAGNLWSSTNNSSNGSALSYIPEEAWNDSVQDGGLAATGGGASADYSKPGWQWGPGVPDDGARDVPDVALAASADHDGYLICSQGSCVNGFRAADDTLMVVGGTSVGAPSFAGIVALIDQKKGAAQGNVNYVLYPLAAKSSDAFHDITINNNKVACQLGTTDCPNGVEIGYSAGPGYDQTTGLGSVDALNLANEWASVTPAPRGSEDFQLAPTPSSLSISAGTTSNASITLTALNKFSGTVTLTCSVAATLPGTTCSVSPASLATSGVAMLTVKAPAASASLFGRPGFKHGPGWPALALAFGFALTGLGVLAMTGRRARGEPSSFGPRRGFHAGAFPRRLGLGLILASLLAAGFSCGGGSTPTSSTTTHTTPPPVTGKVTVKGVSGNLQHLADVTVTVN
ncbi:MAG TPA: S53 family peptidase, partial [Terriglobia bacterium]|nr:S53 family peptidase [Terriglobia bacterium]